MQGSLSQISLNDILLLATSGKKSGLLRLSRGKEIVDVFLSEGNIIHASCPIGDGQKALLYPVTWGEGTFVLLPNGAPPSQTISKQSAELLNEVKTMSQEWERILQVVPKANTVFRMADLGDETNESITIPHTGWKVLSKMDGVRDVQALAESLRLPYAYTAKVIYDLHQSGLVEVAPNSAGSVQDAVPPGFVDRMISELTEAMGPMASVIVHDQIAALGESPDTFPTTRLDELIESISSEILDEPLKSCFLQQMLGEIRTYKTL